MERAPHDDGLRLIARRPRTRRELRGELVRRGHDADAVESVLERLEAEGYLDDAALAADYIVTRSARLGHGPARLVAELERRGVPRAVADAAWRAAVEAGDVDPAERLRQAVDKCLQGRAGLDSKRYARVYNALLRAGYDGDRVRRELEPYRAETDPFGATPDDGTNDDFP